jgi:hypothetical protein
MRPDRRHAQARRILAQRVRVGPEIVDCDQWPSLAALMVNNGVRRVDHRVRSCRGGKALRKVFVCMVVLPVA